MFPATLQMINGFIKELQVRTAVVRPVIFLGLPENKQSLTNYEDLMDDQHNCYIVIVVSALKLD